MSLIGKRVRIVNLDEMAHYTRDSGLVVGDEGVVVQDVHADGFLLGVSVDGKPYKYEDGTEDEDNWFAFFGSEVEVIAEH